MKSMTLLLETHRKPPQVYRKPPHADIQGGVVAAQLGNITNYLRKNPSWNHGTHQAHGIEDHKARLLFRVFRVLRGDTIS